MAALSPKINTAPTAGRTEGAGYHPLSPAVNREDLAPSRGKESIVKGLEKEVGKKPDKILFPVSVLKHGRADSKVSFAVPSLCMRKQASVVQKIA